MISSGLALKKFGVQNRFQAVLATGGQPEKEIDGGNFFPSTLEPDGDFCYNTF